MLINSNLLADKFKNGISLLAKRGYLQTGEQGICIKAVKGNQTAVAKTETEITITYDTEPHFYMALARSLGMDMGTQVIPAKVDRLGYMLDCSRNAVAKPEMVKDLISFLILAGYNYLELYTEDTYALPDEPYFGYRRGRYTVEELEEIIFHASSCEFQNLYFEITNKFMKKNTYDKTVELKLSKLGKEVHALGGALIAIENVVFAN